MVPAPTPSTSPTCPAPRTRGDGPHPSTGDEVAPNCSPHARGWSLGPDWTTAHRDLLPARAGMVPPRPLRRPRPGPAPRTRGDGPLLPAALYSTRPCSPHARGWSRRQREAGLRIGLLPARAGMAPRRSPSSGTTRPAPRTRGDGPSSRASRAQFTHCSPHARGWPPPPLKRPTTCGLLPARAGMVPPPWISQTWRQPAPRTRGDGPCAIMSPYGVTVCSPHARGWSLVLLAIPEGFTLLPARAGMVPYGGDRLERCTPAPRTRGDGPAKMGHPSQGLICSPHARGWSREVRSGGRRPRLLPARAGMVPATASWRSRPSSAPRTRGDGPRTMTATTAITACSPHARGWSHHGLAGAGRQDLLPARAGMVQGRAARRDGIHPAPRTRGDGPDAADAYTLVRICSPYPRGWSQLVLGLQGADPLLPARAGMVPSPAPATSGRPAPLTRGDGPRARQKTEADVGCSPQPRPCLRPRPVCCGRSSAEPEHRRKCPRTRDSHRRCPVR